MTFTLRAVLAVALLAGVCLIGVGLTVAFLVGISLAAMAFSRSPGGSVVLELVLVAAVLVLAASRGLLTCLRRRRSEPVGIGLERDQAILWAVVATLAEAVGVRGPDEIRLTGSAQVTVHDDGRLLGLVRGRRRLLIGLPLLVELDRG